ncbi:hypothetical protein TCAL_05219 [Tigriopus californicus]|uniref:BPTI/Kunitz inhibitor domain-containing protein n=1 Tax=Tigriopus californicus TaxID=6832 RepID=A0A553NS09_TIGCA|nr:uncharacterized protein LOC131877739 [Tigriopus californicus]TRY68226.1 hypothetical protein TCAL_05219 [Tigriopus californicus]|eukprot:TCALIF_05219-PA protein Name:"Similar to Kunitz-1 (Trittame loki)" AED:0.00 eAED:0.00 QI:222/1/1/1/1/1/2/102/171
MNEPLFDINRDSRRTRIISQLLNMMQSRASIIVISASLLVFAQSAHVSKRSDDLDFVVVGADDSTDDCPSTPFTPEECLASNPGAKQCVNSVAFDGCNTCCCNDTPVDSKVCGLPKRVGFGRASLYRWFFNGDHCEEFVFNGAHGSGSRDDLVGNENNFACKELCESTCSP